jgi:hypothetical protein
MKLLIVIILALVCSSCVDSITFRGKYADYTVAPHHPIIFDEK